MKNCVYVLLGLIIFSYAGCKSDSDVLATFNDGQITRGDFYEWLEARRVPKDAVLKKKSQQKNKLKRMALEEFIVREAKKVGFDKNDEFKYLISLAKRNYYASSMGKKIRSDGLFKEKAAKVRIIKLLVKNYKMNKNNKKRLSDVGLELAFKEKIDKAKSIIKELENGESFEGLAKDYSDDFSKKKGGDIGYITPGMRGEEFSKAVFSLKDGEFTKDPVRIRNVIYIIKVDSRIELSEENIDDIIKDKKQRTGFKRRIMMKKARQFHEKLMKAKDVENHIDKNISSKNPNILLFKIGDKEYKISNLNKIIAFIEKKRKGMGRRAKPLDDKIKKSLADRILMEELLMREVIKRGIAKEPKFIKGLELFMNYNLAGSYESEVISSNIKVTREEVLAHYNKNKDKLYTRKDKKGGKKLKRVIPFNTVKERIEYRLLNKKRSMKRKTQEAELMKKNKFSIIESELEGD